MRLVVLGDLNLDVCAHAPAMPERGAELRDQVVAVPGGSAGSFARTAAALGASVAFIGCVGNDPIGELLIRSLEEAEIVPFVQRTDRPSGIVLALELGEERTMICSRGANDGIVAEHIDATAFVAADHLHVSGYALLSPSQRDAAATAIAAARGGGASISIDPPPANLIRRLGVERFLRPIPDGAWLFPNRSEGMLLAGAERPSEIAHRLAVRYPVGAVTLGGDGALAWARDEIHRETTDRIAGDTTGAGDAFAGAFVVTYLETGDLARAARAGCRIAGERIAGRRDRGA